MPAGARAAADGAAGARTATLAWERVATSSTDLTITITRDPSAPAQRWVGDGCEVPWFQVPVVAAFETDDGRLRDALGGWMELRDGQAAHIEVSSPASSIAGSLDLTDLADDEDAVLRAAFGAAMDVSPGQLFVLPARDADDVRIGAW